MLLRDSDAGVFHLDAHVRCLLTATKADEALLCIADGVAHEIPQDLADERRVAARAVRAVDYLESQPLVARNP